jgi:hypothetical protein
MRSPLRKIREWNERRWLTSGVKAWERRRAKGVWRFILLYGLLWGAWMFVIMSLWEYFCLGRFGIKLRSEVIFPVYLVGGWFVGFVKCIFTEDKYQKTIKGKS